MIQRAIMTPSVSTGINQAEDDCEEILIIELGQFLKLSEWMRMASSSCSERTTRKLTEVELCHALKNICCPSRAALQHAVWGIGFSVKKFIHFDRNRQTSSSQLQQMAVQKTEDICLWLIRLWKRLWEFEIELSRDLVPPRWKWSHLHLAKGLMMTQIHKGVLLVGQGFTV